MSLLLLRMRLWPLCVRVLGPPAAYNKRTSLLHIRRLREVLSFHLVNFANTPSPSLFSHYCPIGEDEEMPNAPSSTSTESGQASGSKKKTAPKKAPAVAHDPNKKSSAPAVQRKGSEEPTAELHPSLADFYPPISESEPRCLKSIEFAGWNPPPGNRALLGPYLYSSRLPYPVVLLMAESIKRAGDLYYLQVTTLEGQTLFITAWTHGFYVNCCTGTVFNPKPATKRCSSHSLSGVLSQVPRTCTFWCGSVAQPSPIPS